jgi:hypothetical protein
MVERDQLVSRAGQEALAMTGVGRITVFPVHFGTRKRNAAPHRQFPALFHRCVLETSIPAYWTCLCGQECRLVAVIAQRDRRCVIRCSQVAALLNIPAHAYNVHTYSHTSNTQHPRGIRACSSAGCDPSVTNPHTPVAYPRQSSVLVCAPSSRVGNMPASRAIAQYRWRGRGGGSDLLPWRLAGKL